MAAPKEVALSELNVNQLTQLSQQLDQELELLQNSLQSLKVAQGKFTECKESLGKISQSSVDVLVPLTSSMYIPGQLSDVEMCLVDIGTGYYIEQKISAAKEYYQRKVVFLTTQLEKIQPLLQEKYHMKEAVVEMLQMKVQSQMASQQQLAATKAS